MCSCSVKLKMKEMKTFQKNTDYMHHNIMTIQPSNCEASCIQNHTLTSPVNPVFLQRNSNHFVCCASRFTQNIDKSHKTKTPIIQITHFLNWIKQTSTDCSSSLHPLTPFPLNSINLNKNASKMNWYFSDILLQL